MSGPGLEEYYLLFDLLEHRKQYPIKDFDDLAFVLEAIWLKSNQYRNKFRQVLQVRKAKLQHLIEVLKKEPEILTSPDETKVDGKINQIAEPVTDLNVPTAQERVGVTENAVVGDQKKAEKKPHETADEDKTETVFSLGTGQAGAGSYFQLAKETNDMTLLQTPFLFTNDYFPIKNRNLLQAWRTLKNKAEGKTLPEIDIKKTIVHTARKGFFSSLLLCRELENQLQLFILLDCSDTMVAVEEFGKELVLTASRSHVHINVRPWYFSTIPHRKKTDDYLVYDESFINPKGIRQLFGSRGRRNIVVLLYSDAGALKNNFDVERIMETEHFLHFLNRQAGYTAWLNPAPKERWSATNAEKIKEMIPMFDTTRTDVEKLMSALKGKFVRIAQAENNATT